MSGIRVSNVWALENEYGKGLPEGASWIAPPPGSYISFSINRSANKLYSPGSKTFDTVAYGAVGGSWSWNFTFDYKYLEPFLVAFDEYSVSKSGDKYIHKFCKANNKRVKSFTIRRKQLNRINGGTSDEITEIKGCVCKSTKFSMQAGSSQINVSMSGFFSDLNQIVGNLTTTDYAKYKGDLAEFSCMYIGSASTGEYVANVDSMSIGIDNASAAIYSTCSPFSKEYNEGFTSNSLSVSCYSNNPKVFKQRVFGGGTVFEGGPKTKGLSPVDQITIASYSYASTDGSVPGINDAVTKSDNYAMFTIEDCVLKGIEWQRGDGAKIMDQLSSVDCRNIYLEVKNNIPNIEGAKDNHVISANPAGVPVMMASLAENGDPNSEMPPETI